MGSRLAHFTENRLSQGRIISPELGFVNIFVNLRLSKKVAILASKPDDLEGEIRREIRSQVKVGLQQAIGDGYGQ